MRSTSPALTTRRGTVANSVDDEPLLALHRATVLGAVDDARIVRRLRRGRARLNACLERATLAGHARGGGGGRRRRRRWRRRRRRRRGRLPTPCRDVQVREDDLRVVNLAVRIGRVATTIEPRHCEGADWEVARVVGDETRCQTRWVGPKDQPASHLATRQTLAHTAHRAEQAHAQTNAHAHAHARAGMTRWHDTYFRPPSQTRGS